MQRGGVMSFMQWIVSIILVTAGVSGLLGTFLHPLPAGFMGFIIGSLWGRYTYGTMTGDYD